VGLRDRRPGWFAALAAAALLVVLSAPGATVAASAPPKVAIIVGPVGSTITERYRQAADAAAAVALTLTPDVVKVYSPDATWPAVRAAVTGASVVVYLGHGNGWPSPYASVLQSRTMDGFGLNPVAGVDDSAHQYFGEAFVSKLRLAPGAVVLLSHLCYASGSSEPGMSDGTFSDILSRVDNFAAGFLKAGAGAVVAEGHQNPAALMAAALRGPASVAKAWDAASWGHHHITSYASTRTKGAAISLDPDTATAGYYRSIVRAPGSAGSTVSAPSSVAPVSAPSAPPSLASAGTKFGNAVVNGTVAPGQTTTVKLPVTKVASALPASMLVGVRWLPLVSAPPEPGSASTDDGLVVGEASADVVDTATASVAGSSLQLRTSAPTTPGAYVVLMTLEASDGTPYDVATQSLLRPFIVIVPKPVDLRITAPAGLVVPQATPVHLDVSLANTGTQPWGSPLYASAWDDAESDPVLDQPFEDVLSLSATWLNPATGMASPAASYPLPRQLGAPGHTADVSVDLLAPPTAGQYLLVLSLAVKGDLGEFPEQPLLVPVTVSGVAATPTPTPSAGPDAVASATPSAAP
jgi:hypothetical protein